jgi:hypothetical protein
MLTVRGDRSTPAATPHRQASVLPQAPGLRPSHRKAFGLQLFGHPPTPITLARLRMNRFHPRQEGHFISINPGGSVLMGIRIKAAATDIQHLTQDRNRPGVLVLEDTGVSHLDSLAKKPRACFKMSRSIRKRLFSSGN